MAVTDGLAMRELTRLRELLAGLDLDDRTPAGAAAMAARQDLVDRIDRLFAAEPMADRPDRLPVTVALLGPSGAGKSTLLNKLVGHEVTTVGARRPTTTRAVWVASPADQAVLRRQVGAAVHTTLAVPAGLALVEHPDTGVFDALPTTAPGQRWSARGKSVPAADVYLVVVSPTRYADRRVWDLLARLPVDPGSERVALVLNRFPNDSRAVTGDLSRRLGDAGLRDVMVVAVPDDLAALQAVRASLWTYAGYPEPASAEQLEQAVSEEAVASFARTLEEDLRPLLRLDPTLLAPEHDRPLNSDLGGELLGAADLEPDPARDRIALAHQLTGQVRPEETAEHWARLAWRASAGTPAVVRIGELGELGTTRQAGGGALGTDPVSDGATNLAADLADDLATNPAAEVADELAEAAWSGLHDALLVATRRQTRGIQQLAGSGSEPTGLVRAGRASRHITELDWQVRDWLRRILAELDDVIGVDRGASVEAVAVGVALAAVARTAGLHEEAEALGRWRVLQRSGVPLAPPAVVQRAQADLAELLDAALHRFTGRVSSPAPSGLRAVRDAAHSLLQVSDLGGGGELR
ncbi:GTPase [Euzebya tangerina]|uniref:GTPase n=1 Tax=Euzebya tangerina TaxID=591198 RepID=UPI000E322B15|nr:GTPase [Euzebya tangerina]